ncbi:MAG: HEAT repeat domain-containing protein [Acidobacteria bacterium]|nr:HEAT repeat domain-containing protein [Acidobacteriota bacterium]
MRSKRNALAGLVVVAVLTPQALGAQAPGPTSAPTPAERGPQALSAEAIRAAIDALGTVDASASGAAFTTRMNAARALRRASADAVVPALINAVESHENGYVRFRALVLLTAFSDARAPDVVREAAGNANDRLRTVAYMYYEHHPTATMIPSLLQALGREDSEFVRPALVRALAAQASDPRVRETLLMEVGRGQDYFRSAVIEALGDYRATDALESLIAIARLGGPLQVDAVVALGRLRDARALDTLAALQRSAPRESQPTIAAAICLLGINCDAHLPYLIDTLRFAEKNPGFQELLRNTVTALVVLATAGDARALNALIDTGITSIDPPRAPLAIGAGTIAIRNTPAMLAFLESYPNRDAAIALIAEGFDMLEEDYEEESFFVAVRRAYWQAPEESATRKVGQALIDKLEF